MEVAYHYSSLPTAIKIITSRCLWATDLRRVKGDPHELHHAFGIIRKVAERGDYLTSIKSDAPELLRNSCIHVACLSASATSSSQWEQYGGQGTGCAIGFQLRKIRKLCGRGPKGKHLGIEQFPVIYDDATQEEIIQRLLDGATDIENKYVHSNRLREFRHDVKCALVSFVGIMKAESYRKEQEWRIQADHDSKVEKASSLDGVCRLALPICGAEFIAELVIGPNVSDDGMSEFRSSLEASGGRIPTLRRLTCRDLNI